MDILIPGGEEMDNNDKIEIGQTIVQIIGT